MKRLVLLFAAALVASGCSAAEPQPTTPAGPGAKCSFPVHGGPARAVDPPSSVGIPETGTTEVTVTLNGEPFQITLDQANAPCAVHSFLSLAGQGFFDDTRCHRLLDSGAYLLQCGDPSGTGSGGPGYSFPDELTGSETYTTGTVAMANAGADTNGSQFFLVYADSPLDPHYTVLGHMDARGVELVGAIGAQGVDATDQTTPIADAVIDSVVVG